MSVRLAEIEKRLALTKIDDAIAAGGGLRIDQASAEAIVRELERAFLMGRIVGTAEGFVLCADIPGPSGQQREVLAAEPINA